MEYSGRLSRVECGIRFALWDHIVGVDLRLDREDRFTMIVGVPFVSVKFTLWLEG